LYLRASFIRAAVKTVNLHCMVNYFTMNRM
jgi:hypothetical protein